MATALSDLRHPRRQTMIDRRQRPACVQSGTNYFLDVTGSTTTRPGAEVNGVAVAAGSSAAGR